MAEVEPEALRADAMDGWQKWSLTLGELKTSLDGLSYSASDFSLIPGATEVYQAVQASVKTLHDYIHTGEEVFEGIARALLDTAVDYMVAEGDAQSEIDAVRQEAENL
jgi:hypothetical protein